MSLGSEPRTLKVRIAPFLFLAAVGLFIIATDHGPTPLVLGPGLMVTACLLGLASWSTLSWCTVALLLVLSRGFVGVTLPGPLNSVPLALVMTIACAIGTRTLWLPVIRRLNTAPLTQALVPLGIWTAFRLGLDYAEYGGLALRDALFIVYFAAIPMGIACASARPQHELDKRLDVIFGFATAWYLLYPIRETLESAGPIVGSIEARPLLSFVGISFVPMWAFLRFSGSPGVSHALLAAGAALGVLLSQYRFAYIGAALGLTALALARKRGSQHSFHREAVQKTHRSSLLRLLIPCVLAATVIPAVLPIQGRFTTISLGQIGEQLGTLSGSDGAGSGSVEAREEWWGAIVSKLSNDPDALVFGLGLGPDLTDNFVSRGGQLVRKPHNDYLEYAARLGLVGFLPLVALLFGLSRLVIRSAAELGRPWPAVIWLLYLLMAATQPLMSLAYAAIPAYFLIGLSLGSLDGSTRFSPRDQQVVDASL